MIKAIDVKNIFDIPDFELYVNEKFEFQAYDKADETLMYDYVDSARNVRITIDFAVPDFISIFRKESLLELATMEGIEYFSMCWWGVDYGDDEEDEYQIKTFHYRPLCDDSEKYYV